MNKKHFIIKLTFLILSFSNYLLADNSTGELKGTIIDSKTGETLPGATILLEGTDLGTAADMDGKFTFNKLTPGHYKLTIKCVSYSSKQVEEVFVEPGKATILTITLESAEKQLQEVVITAKAKRESVNALLLLQKNSINVSDGISSEVIKKSPDRSSSDVLKRVSGTTIQDNKFAVIRGLNDRYNAAYINGAPLPSSESDRKAFSFDIFPSALLDNITIVKSASADLPADFAGGIIQINTKNAPEENTQSLSISSGYNSLTTFKKSYDYKGGKLDFIGIDDGSRKLPSGIPDVKSFRGAPPSNQVDAAKLMKNNWAINEVNSTSPSLGLQYTFGRTMNLGGKELGTIFALTYNRDLKTSRSIRREFDEPVNDEKPLQQFELTDNTYSTNILAGAIAGVFYKVDDNNKLGFKTIYNINSDDRVVLRDGIRDFSQNEKILEKSSLRYFTENRLSSNQLSGDHYFTKSKVKIKWIGGYSNIIRNIPDMRRMLYSKNYNPSAPAEEPEPEYTAQIQTSGTSPSSGGNIFHSLSNEKIMSLNYEVSYPFQIKKIKNDIKVGGFHQKRTRSFDARQLGFTRYNKGSIRFDNNLLNLPEDEIFNESNMGVMDNGKAGFKLQEGTKLNDSYSASSFLNAAFIMLDNKITDKFRLIWGVRMEKYNQKLESFEDDGTPIIVDTTQTDFLPSGSLIFSASENSNIRVSYAQTLSRPEFRELAPFGFFDFSTFYSVRGNSKLQRALIHNYDIRYEVFPGRGQVFSSSVFYKKFINPIEQINSSQESRLITYQNIPLVNNYGVELEYRINLSSIIKSEKMKFMEYLTLFSNFAYIVSKADLSNVPDAASDSRPLQGQSPYIINGGIIFNEPDKGYGISLAVNRIGRRITLVGHKNEPDIYEDPRTVVDLQLSKTFFKKWELRVNLKDIFAQNYIFYQDLNKNGKFDNNADNVITETNAPLTVGASLTYKF